MDRTQFHFFFPFRIRYSEIDAQGVVFNAHYLTFFDTALTEYMRALKYNYTGTLADTGADFHVVRSVVDYKKPIRWDEEIEVGCRAARVGRTSITFALGVFGKSEDAPRATGEIVWVHTCQKTHEPRPVPENFIRLLKEKEEEGMEIKG